MASVGDDELAAECGAGVGVEEDGAPVGPPRAPRHVVLQNQEIQQLIGAHER